MLIRVRSKETHISLRIPTALALNRLMASVLCSSLNKKLQSSLSAAQVSQLFAEIRRLRKKYPDWKLVEVDSKDAHVLIRL